MLLKARVESIDVLYDLSFVVLLVCATWPAVFNE